MSWMLVWSEWLASLGHQEIIFFHLQLVLPVFALFFLILIFNLLLLLLWSLKILVGRFIYAMRSGQMNLYYL